MSYKIQKIVFTFGYLRGVAWSMMKAANESEVGRSHNLLAAMLFSAFSLEAFLNHLGEPKNLWKPNQQVNPYKKLELVLEDLGCPVP